MGWAGDDYAQGKRLENLYLDIVDCFIGKTKSQVDEDDLLTYIEDHLSEEFHVVTEGEGGCEEVRKPILGMQFIFALPPSFPFTQVAHVISSLFFECLEGRFERVERLVSSASRWRPMAPCLDALGRWIPEQTAEATVHKPRTDESSSDEDGDDREEATLTEENEPLSAKRESQAAERTVGAATAEAAHEIGSSSSSVAAAPMPEADETDGWHTVSSHRGGRGQKPRD